MKSWHYGPGIEEWAEFWHDTRQVWASGQLNIDLAIAFQRKWTIVRLQEKWLEDEMERTGMVTG